jgi:hypothetical protein
LSIFEFLSILARDSNSDWFTQTSLNDSLTFIVDTSKIIRRNSSFSLFSLWSWKVCQIIM